MRFTSILLAALVALAAAQEPDSAVETSEDPTDDFNNPATHAQEDHNGDDSVLAFLKEISTKEDVSTAHVLSGCRITLAGNPRQENLPVQCTPMTSKLYVRCCSNSGAKVQMSTYGCNKDKTYSQAQDICLAKAFRLCTQAEIVAGKTDGTGCGFDHQRVWTSTATDEPSHLPTRSPTETPTPTPTSPPTETPTPGPTRPPTETPTPGPTRPPTEYPTRLPTRPPTVLPTRPPTRRPTVSPTRPPTNAPPDLTRRLSHGGRCDDMIHTDPIHFMGKPACDPFAAKLNAMINAAVPNAAATWRCSEVGSRADGWSFLSFGKQVDQTNMATWWAGRGQAASDVQIFTQATGIIYFDCRSGKIDRLNSFLGTSTPPPPPTPAPTVRRRRTRRRRWG